MSQTDENNISDLKNTISNGETRLHLMPFIPKQLSLFDEEDLIPVIPWELSDERYYETILEEGISVINIQDGLSVCISGYGVGVYKKDDRLVLKKKEGKTIWHIPFDRISELVISSRGISLTTDLLSALSDRGIRCNLISGTGRPVAQLSSPLLTGTVKIRRAQYEALNSNIGLRLVVSMITGKMLNQAHLLKYFSKRHHQANTPLYNEIYTLINQILSMLRQLKSTHYNSLEKSRSAIMGFEGSAARSYWKAVGRLIEERATFDSRQHRGASDFVNSCLNYGYGILYSHVWGAVLNAGLEPFAGFLHTDRPGKPSMVLDLTEEFRAPVVDRAIIAAINLGEIKQSDHSGRLSQDTRDVIVSKVFDRLESLENYQGGNYRIRSIIQLQARQVASFIVEKSSCYRAFRFKW